MITRAFLPPLEKTEQRAIVRLFELAGFRVGSTSQYRASGQLVGLPDLVLLHRGLKRGGFFEVKGYMRAGYDPSRWQTWRPKELKPAQQEFRAWALDCGLLYGWGGLREAEQFLVDLGLAESGDGGFRLKANRSN